MRHIGHPRPGVGDGIVSEDRARRLTKAAAEDIDLAAKSRRHRVITGLGEVRLALPAVGARIVDFNDIRACALRIEAGNNVDLVVEDSGRDLRTVVALFGTVGGTAVGPGELTNSGSSEPPPQAIKSRQARRTRAGRSIDPVWHATHRLRR
jgi:hypothetical protein